MNWNEEFDYIFRGYNGAKEQYQNVWSSDTTPNDVYKFIHIQLEKLIEDSKSMSAEELTAKWL